MTLPATWFSRVGEPLAPADRDEIAALIHDHPLLGSAKIDGVGHWHEAGAIVRVSDRDTAWWEHEEDERQSLWQRATERFAEADLLARLTAVTETLADAVRGCATKAAARDGVADPGLIGAASGAALMAAHQNTLAAMAGEAGTHFFARKYTLFVGGRWPLGYYSGRYIVF
jgi:ABC-type Fe3+-siderophore transport system permease subunit